MRKLKLTTELYDERCGAITADLRSWLSPSKQCCPAWTLTSLHRFEDTGETRFTLVL
jgi:hypothetical protein